VQAQPLAAELQDQKGKGSQMSTGLKLLGIAMAAVAFLAVAVAQASAASFKAESTPIWLKGELLSETVLAVSAGNLKCSVISYSSTAALSVASVATVEVHPAYSGCSAFGGLPATVSTTSCSYVLSINASSTAPLGGLVGIKCSGATSININLPSGGPCSISVAEQDPPSATDVYTENGTGAKRDVTIVFSVTGLAYTASGKSCGTSGTNGTYKGAALIFGFKSSTFSEQIGFFLG
jgi:hypothetical protein